MTLIELLVSVLVIGAIATVLAAAVTVTFRSQDATQARLDVARWEQSLALWLPADLASASDVRAEPGLAPCTSSDCTFGSNALQLKWNDGSGETTVSYRYGPAAGGASYVLTRVECKGATCTSQVVLRDLAPPGPVTNPDGTTRPWVAGDEVPNEVIDVTVPLVVTGTDPDGSGDTSTSAQRVIVNVNGAPGGDGEVRSSRVSFTAGGSSRGELPPAVFTGPTFLQAKSGCGGPVTLIVDDSGSIGSDINQVKNGVKSFVRAFDGTPTQLQIVRFDSTSSTLGTSGGSRFYDLSEPSVVSGLLNSGSPINNLSAGGGTNWEDALHRTFYTSNGTSYAELGDPTRPPSELVVFFTDGVPTYDRRSQNTDSSSVGAPHPPPNRFDTGANGNDFSPRAWYRADWIVDQVRGSFVPSADPNAPDEFVGVRLIGVGVGNAFDDTTRVTRSGWPTGANQDIPNETFIGDLVAGGDPSGYDGTRDYVVRRFSNSTGWGDVTTADLLVTNNFNEFGSALTQIALAECGGTLTVQTRDGAGDPADADVTYQVGSQTVTTTRISKSGTFDIPLVGVSSLTVDVVPQSLADTGYTATGWNCRAGGDDLVLGSDYSLISSSDPAAGVRVTVSANAAVSCTMRVA